MIDYKLKYIIRYENKNIYLYIYKYKYNSCRFFIISNIYNI